MYILLNIFFLNSLIELEELRDKIIEESGNLYLDNEKVGKKVGQSKGLRNELNRTNPSLRLK